MLRPGLFFTFGIVVLVSSFTRNSVWAQQKTLAPTEFVLVLHFVLSIFQPFVFVV